MSSVAHSQSSLLLRAASGAGRTEEELARAALEDVQREASTMLKHCEEVEAARVEAAKRADALTQVTASDGSPLRPPEEIFYP